MTAGGQQDALFAFSKVCGRCGQEKPSSEFHPKRGSSGQLAWECRECSKLYQRERYANNPDVREKAAFAHIRSTYNLTREQYDAMLDAQGGVCAVCKKVPRSGFRVDHDHNTGVVRGLLCNACNSGMGHLQDDPALLRSAIAYLERGGHCE